MALGMSITALADETYSITINNDKAGHTYQAYQVFKGDLSESTLSNIEWGAGVDGTVLLTALQEDTTIGTNFAKCTTAADVAAVLAKESNDSDLMKAFAAIVGKNVTTVSGNANTVADGKYTIGGLAAGYYFVKDADNSLAGKEDDAYTRYILKVVTNVEVTPKSDVPEVNKTVKDQNDSIKETASEGKFADYDIGDDVPFTLTGTLPSNYADYKTYKYVFYDTLSAGLTYNSNAKVTIDTAEGTDITDKFKIDLDGTALTIACDNLKAITDLIADSEIIVTYTAKLNESAKIGVPGNENKVKLEFSNDPNYDGDGEPTGTTPEDTVIVFTYKTIVNKVDQDKNPLKGAAFKLEKYYAADNNWKTVKEFTLDEKLDKFEFAGLDEGRYKLTETVTPGGYNTIDPIEFEITATIGEDGKGSYTITDLTGTGTEITFTSDVNDGSLEADVVNQAGSVLPSTGGMGTTIFYVVGAILTVGAAVLLIVKRRMRVR